MKFKVGDKVTCKHPVVVCDDFTGKIGVVVDTSAIPEMDTGEQVITIDYDGCEQTAYVDLDGVEHAEQQKSPTEQTVEPKTISYDLSGFSDIDKFMAETLFPVVDKSSWEVSYSKVKSKEDNVNSPSHYGQGNIEAIEYIEDFLTREEYIGYLRGNIAKYMHRFRYKGKAYEDLKKADWYKARLNKLFEGE